MTPIENWLSLYQAAEASGLPADQALEAAAWSAASEEAEAFLVAVEDQES